MSRQPNLEPLVAARDPLTRTAALLQLGRFADAAALLDDRPSGEPRWAVLAASVAAARGELVEALDLLTAEAPDARGPRALLLSFMGRADAALTLLEGAEEPHLRLARARVHVASGEAAAASVCLPIELPSTDAGVPLELSVVERTELTLTDAEIAIESNEPERALSLLHKALETARRAGATTVMARTLSLLGEAHADARHRWRALRCTVRAVDLIEAGTVAVEAQPGIFFRAFQIYGMYGHRARSDSSVESGHHLVIQLASGIEDRDQRESFFLENRHCQGLVAAWKGDSAWGAGVLRA